MTEIYKVRHKKSKLFLGEPNTALSNIGRTWNTKQELETYLKWNNPKIYYADKSFAPPDLSQFLNKASYQINFFVSFKEVQDLFEIVKFVLTEAEIDQI